MEVEKPRIPLEVRYFIIAQNTAGYKQLEIVDQVLKEFGIFVSQGSVSEIISNETEDKTVEDLSRSGRPKKLSKEEERALVKAVESDRTLNATRLFGDPKLNPPGPSHPSARSISRTLNSHGLFDSTDTVKEISAEAINERLKFALKCQKEDIMWERVNFSDENDLFPGKMGKLHHRRCEGERVDLNLVSIATGTPARSRSGEQFVIML